MYPWPRTRPDRMKQACPCPSLATWLFAYFLLALALAPQHARAQTAPTGIIEGVVFDSARGNNLSKASVRVENTTLEVFTDDFGNYRISGVPEGTHVLRTFFTGLPAATGEVQVTAGQTTRKDFDLGQALSKNADAVVLEKFVVSTSKEMDARSHAINEQRFASNVKNVVATDEFGGVSEGNVGEFAKFLPGVSVNYNDGDGISMGVRGMPAQYTSITSDGNPMASPSSLSNGRSTEMEQVSINNYSRIEVSFSRTPDIRADALGGSINMIGRDAFEHTRPKLNFGLYMTGRDNEPTTTLGRAAGPSRGESHPIRPAFDFSWIMPLSDRVGFTVTGLHSNVMTSAYRDTRLWVPDGRGVPTGFTPPTGNNPYLSQYSIEDLPKKTARTSFGTSVSFRLTPQSTITWRSNYTYYNAMFRHQGIQFDVGQGVTAWGPDFTQGGVGRGIVSLGNGSNVAHKRGGTWNHAVAYRLTHNDWKVEANASLSDASLDYSSPSKGLFQALQADMRNVTIRFDNINPAGGRPNITVRNAAGQLVDPYNLSNYTLVSASDRERSARDTMSAGNLSLQRDFSGKIPLTIKIGADVRQQIRYSTRRRPDGQTLTFIGRDGVARTADDNAAQVLDEVFSQRKPMFGLAGIPSTQWPSPYEMYDLFLSNPAYYRRDEAAKHRDIVNNSFEIKETVAAYYLRADTKLIQNRLKITTGVRFEKTTDVGNGPLVDNEALYLRDAAGNFVLNSSGARIRKTTDALESARLAYIYKGAFSRKSYSDYYPSINASFELTDNTIVRAAFATALGRPDFSNIVPGLTLPDPESTSRTIVIRNTSLRPWTAQSYDVSFEHYLKPTGIISLGLFRRDIKNFFAATTLAATPELLAQYDLDQDTYGEYLISTQFNSQATGRVTGFTISYKQAFDFLPEWLHGFQGWVNYTHLRLSGGSPEASFKTNAGSSGAGAFVPHVVNLGLSYARSRFSVQTAVNYTGESPGSLITSTGIPTATRSYRVAQYNVEGTVQYRLSRHFSVFGNVKNGSDDILTEERASAGTPDYARLYNRWNFGRLYTVGVKGEF